MNANNDGHAHGPRLLTGLSHRSGDGLTIEQLSDRTEAANARQDERRRTDATRLLAERVDTAKQASRRTKQALGEPETPSADNRATDNARRGELRIPIRPRLPRPNDSGPLTEADLAALTRLVEREKRKDQQSQK